jgi:hypothetical protein
MLYVWHWCIQGGYEFTAFFLYDMRGRKEDKDKLDMVMHIYNPSTQYTEAVESRVCGQPGLFQRKKETKKRKPRDINFILKS